MKKDNNKCKILTFVYYDIKIKEVRKQIDTIIKMAVYGSDQVTMTVERSETKCGHYNMIIYVSPEQRLNAIDIAQLYKLLSQGKTPNEIHIGNDSNESDRPK